MAFPCLAFLPREVGDSGESEPALKELPVGCGDRHLSKKLWKPRGVRPWGVREGFTEEEH